LGQLCTAALSWAGLGCNWLGLRLGRWYGTVQGFALRNDSMLQLWFQDVARNAARGLFIVCLVMVFWPVWIFKGLSRADRVHWVLSTLLATLAVVLAKQLSQSSCPWSLSEFVGTAPFVSHWQWGMAYFYTVQWFRSRPLLSNS
jgi:membrane-associated PAP2 superfamily phosphatase